MGISLIVLIHCDICNAISLQQKRNFKANKVFKFAKHIFGKYVHSKKEDIVHFSVLYAEFSFVRVVSFCYFTSLLLVIWSIINVSKNRFRLISLEQFCTWHRTLHFAP